MLIATAFLSPIGPVAVDNFGSAGRAGKRGGSIVPPGVAGAGEAGAAAAAEGLGPLIDGVLAGNCGGDEGLGVGCWDGGICSIEGAPVAVAAGDEGIGEGAVTLTGSLVSTLGIVVIGEEDAVVGVALPLAMFLFGRAGGRVRLKPPEADC